jgi:RNA polymerase sigma factor for flagellar operon FliA
VRSLSRRVEAAEQKVAVRQGRHPDDDELAREAGIGVEKLVELRGRVRRSVLVALDQGPDGIDSPSVAAKLTDRAAPLPDETVEAAELRGYVRDAIAHLPERHRMVAVGLYLESRSFDELAELLGVTPSRISQLRAEAVEMMREGVNAQYRTTSAREPVGRVARRKAQYASAIAGNSTWRERLDARSA